ncbi:cadherin domain-containing protein [Oscillatoria sp. CS-180]|uniref:cadherin domain-containing protein n=1 Tax=Oscillatoria sp. CS-180 TaxID=3021720 RepID=UPI00233085EE|nr:cadherin domain-containing protein [Oscillatoria sp. CS-180]MDB9524581.1 cadherin domain-containing protein [Oscillatoria sp. CS-180]
MAFDPVFNLADLDGSTGFVINGIDANDFSSRSVSGAGDINGDGIDDLIIGARYADPNGSASGESYVVFGRAGGFEAALELSELNGSTGFVINGIDERDRSGVSVSSAGDVNGDGVDDLIIGADLADPNGSFSGESYVVFGRASGFGAALELSALDGSNGFVINGIDGGRSGRSVSSAGDINGDGVADLIIGAPIADPNGNRGAGESYVVFGRASGFEAALELSDLDGSNGFVINGIAANDSSGVSVSSAGDINGDGVADLIIGAPFASPNGNYSGESYVVFGRAGGFEAALELSALDGSNGFVINGIAADDRSGVSVSSMGDINGDGVADLIIGAPIADPNGNADAGESYVVFGRASGFGAALELSDLDGSNGFVINGIDAGDYSGVSVSDAGDVNGDGVADLIIGAYRASPNGNSGAGKSYVVFGRAGGFEAALELSELDGGNGFVINGIDANDNSGISVSSAGDVNGDDIDDLIVGAPGGDPNGKGGAGESYVIFGRRTNQAPSLDLGATAFTVAENTAFVTDLNATDDADSEGDGLTYQLSGGDDQARFALDADTGELTFQTPPDFENPLDVGADNIYEVAVTVTDGGGLSETQSLTITVTDVDEFIPLNGTRRRDTLTGTEADERITGFQGPDRLTGGGGRDQFIYTSPVDGGDTITDFTVGEDQIVMTTLLERLGYAGSDPLTDGLVQFRSRGSGSIVAIDPDGLDGPAQARNFLTVEGVAPAALNQADNFIF